MTLELADSTLLDSLLSQTTARKPYTKAYEAETMEPVRKARYAASRCRCGRCRPCVDDARWERIFQEKFADPTYYTQPASRGGSSLGWL